MSHTGLSDLPVDVFLLICNFLDASSFVHLTSTCKSLHNGFADEASIWSKLIRTTFRVANQPVVEHDGARWKKLYRKLKTQTHAYTWGSNGGECLGQTGRLQALVAERGRMPVVSWPEEMEHMDDIGVISEMQCGGWSTSLLTSNGALRISGVLDGMDHGQMFSQHGPATLSYPPGFTTTHSTYDSTTAVKQFSHGRQHLLALSDSGRIWSWNNASRPAWHVKFLHHSTVERRSAGKGVIVKVFAGWSKSAALVEGSGIIVWEPLKRGANDNGLEDTALVQDSELVPNTDCNAESTHTKHSVLNFIVLESSIVFITTNGQLFFSRIDWDNDERLSQPQAVPLDQQDGKVIDVQGSFRSFAVFTDSGAVLTSTEQRIFDTSSDEVFDRIKALQQSEVIAIAFGDYHFHALHAPGHITSYGKEPRSCGAFGLGTNTPEARLRGIRQQGMQGLQHRGGDSYLVPHAYTEGRRIWFEREKREWIKFSASGGADPEEAVERIRLALGSPQMDAQGEVSEWIEQEGRDWESKYQARTAEDDGLPAYFALNVAAAGWHSGALVLVDDQLAQALKAAVELPEHDVESSTEDLDVATTDAPGFISGWLTWADDMRRWFLGLPTQTSNQTRSSNTTRIDDDRRARSALRDPTAYGAAPGPGSRYAWADQHFPRLRLTNGTEMPGQVGFSEWRYGRPDFALSTA